MAQFCTWLLHVRKQQRDLHRTEPSKITIWDENTFENICDKNSKFRSSLLILEAVRCRLTTLFSILSKEERGLVEKTL